MKRSGFTLMEMLVVLAIIGVLAGIAYPVSRSMLGKARETACLTKLRSVGAGLQSYLQEHNNMMPELAQGRATKTDEQPVLETVLLPYLESAEAFHCPADQMEFEKTGCSYFWNSTQNGLHISKLAIFGIKDRPDKVPLIYDKEACHPNKVNFLYADMSSSNTFRTVVGN
ncbi:type II secretion system protein [Luteolibacter yonseiensis]|uniref:Type II secretion system protein n=2 Tax=Luteolibacter yonseiensis TaxID=1144680 RepID=A0A934VA06_9BACT|nr:type II secretion system protein [Luteolibacter yonseiensis]